MKKKLCFLLSSIIMFLNICYPVYADVPETYTKSKEYLWQIVKDVGFIGTLPAKGLTYIVNEILHSKGITGQDVETEEEALDYAYRGISIDGDGNIVLNDDAKLFINTWIDDYKNDHSYSLVYPFNIQMSSQSLGSVAGPLGNATNESGESAQNLYFLNGFLNDPDLYSIPYTGNLYMAFEINSSGNRARLYYVEDNGGVLTVNQINPTTYTDCVKYDLVDGAFAVNSQNMTTWLNIAYSDTYPVGYNNSYNNNLTQWFSQKKVSLPFFSNVTLLREYVNNLGLGKYPYYVNNQVYSNWQNSVGDYTITSDNSNKVTIGDINTYIDDHHTETGQYPTLPDINIYIESQPIVVPTPTPTPNPDNPSGSGGATATANNEGINININNNHNINLGIPSLSGNTVSGNGSGSSGGIFDWISSIGGVIGDFIKNVGQLIADTIKGITETITTILADIPNIISVLVEFVYGGLPEELKAIVTLGLTTVIFVGVIKIMRK